MRVELHKDHAVITHDDGKEQMIPENDYWCLELGAELVTLNQGVQHILGHPGIQICFT